MILRVLPKTIRCLLLSVFLSSAANARADQTYDTLIARARNGEAASVLPILQARLATSAANESMRRDLVVIANWAESHQLAVDTYAQLSSPAPAYVLAAVALSNRRLENYTAAIENYQSQLKLTPNDRTAQAGLILSILKRDGADAASQRIEKFLRENNNAHKDKEFVPLLEALAMIREQQTRYTEALAAWQHVIALAPDSKAAQNAEVFVASFLGAASIADDLVKTRRGDFETDARTRLQQDNTAFKIRWGEVDLRVKPSVTRFSGTDAALKASASDLRNPEATRVFLDAATADRLVALRNRVSMKETIALYESAMRDNIKLPTYATSAAADAYLYERQPERSRDLYVQALKQHKAETGTDNIEWQFSLVFAYLECERWREAFELANTIVASTAPQPIRIANATQPVTDNPNYVRALLLRASLHLYGDEYRVAKKQLDEFITLAPHNTSVRSSLASWYSANGKTLRAYDLFSRVLTEDSEITGARIGRTEMLLAMRRWREADVQIQELVKEFPDSRSVQRLQDDWQMLHSPELRINAGFNQSRADATPITTSPQSAREWQVDVTAYSPPLSHNTRFFAHIVATHGKLIDDSEPGQQRYGLGVEHRSDGLSLSAELHRSTFSNVASDNKLGVAVAGTYLPNDDWVLRAAADSNTTDISFKAMQSGVTARKFDMGIERRFELSRSLLVGVSHIDFSDGNRRSAYSASWRERPYSAPRLKIDTDVSFGASQNSRNDVAYFSPSRDQSIEGTVTADWLTWRHYDHSFKQFFSVTAGTYQQADFGTLPLFGARYAHEWSRSRHWGLQYGVAWLKRPYDGVQEQRLRAFLEFNWRVR
jgi:biofilm PGA synthesis protein PgaA